MDNVKKFLAWLMVQPIAVKILAILASICVLVSILFIPSCGVARSSINGNRVVDKNVKDSTHYEVVLEK